MADDKIYKKNIENFTAVTDPKALADKFANMVKNVENMINNNIQYVTWINFQVGVNDPIIFDTSSTNKKENLIASLKNEKTGAGIANQFTLTVKYDAFNIGQESTTNIEALDYILAEVMNFNMGGETTKLRGFIQYGYVAPNDNLLISPRYRYILTNASSDTDWGSGITTYTFVGTSDLALDSDFTTSFEAVDGSNTKLLEVVEKTLYYYYGDPSNPPDRLSGTDVYEDNLGEGYLIDVPNELYDDSPSTDINAISDMNPFQYCQQILSGQISESDSNNDEYVNGQVKSNQMPRYYLYLTEANKQATIHVGYVSPLKPQCNVIINYEFTWGTQSGDIIINWNPEVDLYTWLIAQATRTRNRKAIEEAKSSLAQAELNYKTAEQALNTTKEGLSSTGWRNLGVLKSAESLMQAAQDFDNAKLALETAESVYVEKSTLETEEYTGMYDATLTVIGIPCDVPIGAELRIKPRILENVSRTAGVYMVMDSIDSIDNRGNFTTELKLFRLRSLDERTLETIVKPKEEIKATEETNTQVKQEVTDKETYQREAAEQWVTDNYTSGGRAKKAYDTAEAISKDIYVEMKVVNAYITVGSFQYRAAVYPTTMVYGFNYKIGLNVGDVVKVYNISKDPLTGAAIKCEKDGKTYDGYIASGLLGSMK